MKTHSKCLFVPVKSAEIINNALHWKEGDPAYYKLDQNSCISFEVPFPDERIMRICCNMIHLDDIPEKDKDLPWTEAILLKETQNGFRQLCCSKIKDEFFRTWELEYGNERYIVNVLPEGDAKQKEYKARNFTIPTLKRLGVSLDEISEELNYRETAGITYKGWNDQLYYYTNEQLQYAENYWNEVTVSTINKKYLIDFTREVMNHCADHFCSNFTDQCDYAAAILENAKELVRGIQEKISQMDSIEDKFDIALIEKEVFEGMDLQDMQLLFKKVAADEKSSVYFIELEAHEHECSAIGFISPSVADKLDYDYEKSGLHDFIASILDDMEKENPDHIYAYKGLRIWLSR